MKHHETPIEGKTNVWLTPPEIFQALGQFDLDPCFGDPRPWDTAAHHYGDYGLEKPWFGRIWMNPPYGKEISKWMEKMAAHQNGTALVYVRTDTRWWKNHVSEYAHGLLFIYRRIQFYQFDGSIDKKSTSPSVLIAYSAYDLEWLKYAKAIGTIKGDLWTR